MEIKQSLLNNEWIKEETKKGIKKLKTKTIELKKIKHSITTPLGHIESSPMREIFNYLH